MFNFIKRMDDFARDKWQKRIASHDLLVQRVRADDPKLSPEEFDEQLDALGLSRDELINDAIMADARRAAELDAATIPELRKALDEAGHVKHETTQRHFRERREIEARHRDERNAAQFAVDEARTALETAINQSRFLEETRGNCLTGFETVTRTGTIVQVLEDKGFFRLQENTSPAAYEIRFRECPLQLPADSVGLQVEYEPMGHQSIKLLRLLGPNQEFLARVRESQDQASHESEDSAPQLVLGTISTVHSDRGFVSVQLDGEPTLYEVYQREKKLPFKLQAVQAGDRVECQKLGFRDIRIIRLLEPVPTAA